MSLRSVVVMVLVVPMVRLFSRGTAGSGRDLTPLEHCPYRRFCAFVLHIPSVCEVGVYLAVLEAHALCPGFVRRRFSSRLCDPLAASIRQRLFAIASASVIVIVVMLVTLGRSRGGDGDDGNQYDCCSLEHFYAPQTYWPKVSDGNYAMRSG